MIPEWLTAATVYLKDWLSYQMRVSELPGCSIAVRYRGELVLDEAYGFADLLLGEVMTPRHGFRVASHSKTFTAAAFMKLREEGRVGLDDKLGIYLNGLHEGIASATIGQLLSNGTGAPRDGSDSSYWSGRRPFASEEELRSDFALPPAIPANSRLKYSNHGFALAGLVLEAIVGEPYCQWMEREIVSAAGLVETKPDWTFGNLGILAHGHSAKGLLGRRQVLSGAHGVKSLAPAAGFISTAADLTRFFHAISPHASASFLTQESRWEMTREGRLDAYAAQQQFYGLGTMSGTHKGWHWVGHGGGFLGYLSRTAILPDKQIAISILTNALDGKAHTWVDGAIAILEKFETEFKPPLDLPHWQGRWWNAWGPFDLVAMGNKVFLASPDSNDPFDHAPEVTASGPDSGIITQASAFHHFGEAVGLHRGENNAVVAVHIAGDTWISEPALNAELTERYDRHPSGRDPKT